MRGLQDFFTPELQAMVNNPATPVSDVLALPYIAQSARVGFQKLIQYLAANSADLLRIAFSEAKIAKSAYTILLMGDRTILKPILEDYSFRTVATELLSEPNINPTMIGRLSSLTQSCLFNLQDLATDSCGFIYRLLPHCGNPSVFNFFGTLCSDDPHYEPAQHWLNDMGFPIFVFREFDNLDVGYRPPDCESADGSVVGGNIWKDPIFVRYLCLYQLIAKCCQNSILQGGFRTNGLVDLLKKDFKYGPDFLKSAKWNAINAATTKEIAVPLLNIIPDALNILTDHFEKLRAYRVYALEFVTKMMKLAPLTFDLLLKSSMPQMLIIITNQFPNSTILHSAFLNFTAVGLENTQFASMIASIYAPFVIDCVEEGTNRILLPCCMKMMTLFIEAAKKDKGIALALKETPGFDEFVRKTMKNYMAIISSPYGDDGPTALFKKVKTIFS